MCKQKERERQRQRDRATGWTAEGVACGGGGGVVRWSGCEVVR